jgi:hypothetical protein
MAAVDTVRGPKPRFARLIYLSHKIMMTCSYCSFGSRIRHFTGRTGDQIMLPEQQNKRVIAEEQKQADMQAMMEDCMKRHKAKKRAA